MKKALIIFLLLVSFQLKAQSLSSAVISSGGKFLSNASGSLSVTIGQSLAGDLVSGNVKLHQGFQVNISNASLVTAILDDEFSLNIFPNPVTKQLSIESGSNLNQYQFNLIDMTGRSLPVEQVKTEHSAKLNLSDLTPAFYILRIHRPDGAIRNIAIIKSN